jgi:hypothetical protein
VLSGGLSSVYEAEAPLPDKRLLESGLPLLGIKQRSGHPAVAEVPVVIWWAFKDSKPWAR